MVDARLPERYLSDRRIARLTGDERSSLFVATLWSVSNRTDGRVERADLDIIPMFQAAAVMTLVVQGLWLEDGPDAWIIADFERDQTSKDDLEALDNARRREREKKRRQRAARSPVPGDDTGGLSPGTPQDRQGQARQGRTGQDSDDFEGDADAATGEVRDWATRVPGSGYVQDEEPF